MYEKTWISPRGLFWQPAAHSRCTQVSGGDQDRLVRDATATLAGSTEIAIKLQNTHSPSHSSLVYLHKETQNHMQAFTVNISHIILVIQSRSRA